MLGSLGILSSEKEAPIFEFQYFFSMKRGLLCQFFMKQLQRAEFLRKRTRDLVVVV